MDHSFTRGRFLASALAAGFALAAPGTGQAQGPVRPAGDSACTGAAVGTVGIVDLDCRGRCALALRSPNTGSHRWTAEWYFTVEPQIAGIEPRSPAAGILQIGDRLVAVDGILITTRAGGRRFSLLEPDSSYSIRYRRDGDTREVVLRATRRCGPALEGDRDVQIPEVAVDSVTGEIMWDVPEGILMLMRPDPEGRLRAGSNVRPRLLVARRAAGRTQPEIPMPRYGLNFSCRPSCTGTTTDGERVWRFSSPVVVAGVAEGGPAATAGLLVGDSITHIDGVRIDTRRGGEAFSTAPPGRPVRFSVRGRDGRERTVIITPGGRL